MGLLRIGIYAGALLFSFGEMGFLTEALNLLIALTLAVVFVVLERPRDLRQLPLRRWIAGVLLVGVAAVLARANPFGRALALMVLASALVATAEEDEPRRGEIALLVPATLFFLVFDLARLHLPHLWWLINTAVLGFSGAAGRLIGQDYALSATMTGFSVLVFAACWGFSRLIWGGRRSARDFPVFLGLLAVTNGLVQILLTPLAMGIQRWAPDLDFLLFNSQVIHLVAVLAPIAWYGRRTAGNVALSGSLRYRFSPLVLAAGLLLALGLTLAPRPGPGGGRVIILDQGYLNWEVPVFGRYGERSGGMFGRLPAFLEAQGYEVDKARGPLTPKILSDARALVIINHMEFFGPEEKRVIWDYVARGGSLLILGDHTGVKGIRGPFNDLLEPVRIRFKFDSGTFWAQGWRDALELLPHPIHHDVILSEDIQIWVGASLDFSPPAEPVIVGKYGFSDLGDAANLERSYLGDRVYNPGEQLGDICLVAAAPYGQGRVLVFGDTSPFQNGALVTAWAFAQRVFQWLTGPPDRSSWLLHMALVVAAAILILLAKPALSRDVHAWSILALGLVLGTHATDRLSTPPPLPRIDLPKALVDISHVERIDQLTWYDDCVGGLELSLGRNGYCAMMMRDFSEPLILDSRLLIVIAPAKPFTRGERATIESFVTSGGILILSTGYEEKDASEALFDLFGVSIGNVPLAHFDIEVYGQTVHFPESWPLDVSDPNTTTVARHPEYPDPIMVFVPRGKGGALIIGDSQFLLNHNLESLEEWKLGNILFLKELFERLKAGEFQR